MRHGIPYIIMCDDEYADVSIKSYHVSEQDSHPTFPQSYFNSQ